MTGKQQSFLKLIQVQS